MKISKNLRIEGNKVISYTTHVATIDNTNGVLMVKGWWSATTTRHINKVAEMYGLKKVDEAGQQHEVKDTTFGLMKAFLLMGSDNKSTIEEKVAYKERIVFATMKSKIAGWKKPEDWDTLSPAQKLERLQKVESLV